ncbi:acyl-coenzyme A thioesterase PaaI-like protein [Thiogranum longum]|uniref:Acyl-coenzyme A thioesterase PaaI-like protein n=1 Tax=Thiogranum longum TaxID=1537524 RepID=A0A4R1HLY3_9GAMM|nr:hotdog fold domain-containing protein [Thiogranum longum]TCK18222.1 acyl-coenzyme A thioesterase PaaI-like protein [Thiogranum longum]
MSRSIGPVLRQRWRWLSALPGGRWLFSRILGYMAPYTGSVGARIEQLEPGFCRVRLKDRRAVRNHLHSIHAIALCNLGEMATGLALMNSLPENTRGILVGICANYHHKARGMLHAECRCAIPSDNHEQQYEVVANLHDSNGETVTTVTATWLIGPDKPRDDNAN